MSDGFRFYRFSQCCPCQYILVYLNDIINPYFFSKTQGYGIIHILLCNGIATLAQLQKLFNDIFCLVCICLITYDLKHTIPVYDGYIERSLYFLYIHIQLAQNILFVFHRNIHNCFYCSQILLLRSMKYNSNLQIQSMKKAPIHF